MNFIVTATEKLDDSFGAGHSPVLAAASLIVVLQNPGVYQNYSVLVLLISMVW